MSKRKKQPVKSPSINLYMKAFTANWNFPQTHVIRVQDEGLRLLTRMQQDEKFRNKVDKLLNS